MNEHVTCPACGTPNSGADAYCGACGTSLRPPSDLVDIFMDVRR